MLTRLCSQEETLDHCLFDCHIIQRIWRKFWTWWSLSGPRFTFFVSFKSNSYFSADSSPRKLVFQAVCTMLLWLIWHWRNKLCHVKQEDSQRKKEEDIFLSVQRLSALWIGNRKPNLKLSMERWIQAPFDIH